MDRDLKASKMRLFAARSSGIRLSGNDLSEALYTMSELSLWPDDVDSVSEAQALACWRLVETLRHEQLPEELKM